jgi:hypothetical protein
VTNAINSTLLAAMQTAILDLLPDTCNILSPTNSADGEGGVTTTWGTTGTAIACRLDAQQGREQVSGGAIEPFTAYKLSLPYNAVVGYNNRVQLGTVLFEVKGLNPSQSWNAVVRVDLERL